MKLEVGKYYRYMPTIGYATMISKVLEVKDCSLAYLYKLDTENELVPIEHFDDIYKSSFNIIDLIEVGDYVNGMRVKNIMSVGTSQYVIKKGDGKYVCCGDYGLMDDGSGRSCYALQWNNNQIKEVLTHEQYEANCYKVGE